MFSFFKKKSVAPVQQKIPSRTVNVLTIDFAAMTDLECEDDEFIVLDDAGHPVITDSVAPESGEIAGQRFPEASGIKFRRNPVFEKIRDFVLGDRTELLQLLRRPDIELNAPLPAHSAGLPEESCLSWF